MTPTPRLCATMPNERARRRRPTSNWPSIATLITPERSQSTPASAPRISGIARKIGLLQQPDRSTVRARAARCRPSTGTRRTNATSADGRAPSASAAGGSRARACHTPERDDDQRRARSPRRRAGTRRRRHAMASSPSCESRNVGVAGVRAEAPARRCTNSAGRR